MPHDERGRLLDRLVELSRGDTALAGLYEQADLETLRGIVDRLEDAARAIERAGGRLAAIWESDGGVLIEDE